MVRRLILIIYAIVLFGCGGQHTSIPERYDSSDDGIITDVEDQGESKLCWAYALTSAVESHILKSKIAGFDQSLDLSEGQLEFYSSVKNGVSILVWTSIGPVKEEDYDYCASKGLTYNDLEKYHLNIRIKNYRPIMLDVNSFKKSIFKDGPSYFHYRLHEDFDSFWNYGEKNQVYKYDHDHKNKFKNYHAVLLIGWDNYKKAFLCMNSWGNNGPNGDGTFWISYDNMESLDFYLMNFDVFQLGTI